MAGRSSSAILAAALVALALAGCAAKGANSIAGSRLTIYAGVTLHGPLAQRGRAILDGEKLALEQAGGRVGKYTITFQPLDDSAASAGGATDAKVSDNARIVIKDKHTIAYVGDDSSGSTALSLPILNQLDIPQVSPAAGAVGLTTSGAGSRSGEPGKYYPSHDRSFARVVASDLYQGAALADAANGCSALDVWSFHTIYSAELASDVAQAARTRRITVQHSDVLDPGATSYATQAGNATAPCVVFTGELGQPALRALGALVQAHPKVRVIAADTFASPDAAAAVPAGVASRLVATAAAPDPAAASLAAQRFATPARKRYGSQATGDPYAIFGYEAMRLALDAINRAGRRGADRLSVAKELERTHDTASVIGSYSIDSGGDSSLRFFAVYKLAGRSLVQQGPARQPTPGG